MELMAEQFPGAFTGYKLEVVESHQRTKVDTSGTAKAVVSSFQKLGLDFTEVSDQRHAWATSAEVVWPSLLGVWLSRAHEVLQC
jgi:dihydrodipicolinate reductase